MTEEPQLKPSAKNPNQKLCLACNRQFTSNELSHCPHDKTQLVNLGPDMHLPWIGKIVMAKYEITKPIGKTTTNVIYEAREIATEKALTLYLRSEYNHFSNEAKERLAKWKEIDHPSILKLHAFGRIGDPEDRRSFHVTESLEGERLNNRLKTHNQKNLFWILGIGEQIAEALSAAHKQNLIHGNLSPSSILLCDNHREDGVKLADFALEFTNFTSNTVGLQNLLNANIDYMSPEELQNKPLTVMTDVYKLGATLYEMVVGHPPLTRRTPGVTIFSVINETASMDDIGNAKLANLLSKALQKDPSSRFPSMAEFRRFIASV